MSARKPHIIGLTGSIGMGKSTAAQMFVDAGVPVFDADAEVHKLQAAGGALVEPIEAAFPGTTGDNGVDRVKLGPMVLGNPEKLALLESIIHPVVALERAAFLENNADREILVFDIPLLFEKNAGAIADSIVVVSAPADQQRERVLARPGMTQEKFESILKLQMPDSEKRQRADYVIENGGSMDETRAQIEQLVADLRNALASSAK